MFEFDYTIKFNEVDGAGILFFPNVFSISHYAFEEMVNSFGLKAEIFNNKKIALPIVHSNAEYKDPIKFGDKIKVKISLLEKKQTSFKLCFDIENKKNNYLSARVQTVHVFINKASNQKIEIPEWFMRKLK